MKRKKIVKNIHILVNWLTDEHVYMINIDDIGDQYWT